MRRNTIQRTTIKQIFQQLDQPLKIEDWVGDDRK